jgi:hypothetical protein
MAGIISIAAVINSTISDIKALGSILIANLHKIDA